MTAEPDMPDIPKPQSEVYQIHVEKTPEGTFEFRTHESGMPIPCADISSLYASILNSYSSVRPLPMFKDEEEPPVLEGLTDAEERIVQWQIDLGKALFFSRDREEAIRLLEEKEDLPPLDI